MYLFENSQISNNYVASSRLNSRVVISKGMQLLQFPELGDSNKDKSNVKNSNILQKAKKKKIGKLYYFLQLHTSFPLVQQNAQIMDNIKGFMFCNSQPQHPSPQWSTSAYPAGITGSCLPRTSLVLLLLKSLNHGIQWTNFLIYLLTKNLIQSCEVKYTGEQYKNVNFLEINVTDSSSKF